MQKKDTVSKQATMPFVKRKRLSPSIGGNSSFRGEI
jgi:hypothetical protein